MDWKKLFRRELGLATKVSSLCESQIVQPLVCSSCPIIIQQCSPRWFNNLNCVLQGCRDGDLPEGLARKLEISTVLHGHTGCVNRLAWNQDGSLLASASDDCQVRWRPHVLAQ
jgi:WD40 repeat protein